MTMNKSAQHTLALLVLLTVIFLLYFINYYESIFNSHNSKTIRSGGEEISLSFSRLEQQKEKKQEQHKQQELQEVVVDTRKDYVIFNCDGCGGWGDRLKGLLSSYVVAEILNRRFIIDFTQPCDLDKLIEPNLVKWNEEIKEPLTHTNTHNLNLGYNFGAIRDFEDLNLFTMTNKKYIRIAGAIMFANAFAKNKHVESRLKELNYNLNEFTVLDQIHKWYNKLFKVPERLMDKYMDMLRLAKPGKDSKLICAQVRVGTVTSKGSADEYFMPRNDSMLYWNFIKKQFLETQNMKDDFMIYITSDHESVKHEAESVFGKEKILYNRDSSLHFDRDFKSRNDARCQQLENVLFDFHMLQHCDAAVISHSGFGLFGILNRENRYKNLFMYTLVDQSDMSRYMWNRKNKEMHFIKLNDWRKDIFFK